MTYHDANTIASEILPKNSTHSGQPTCVVLDAHCDNKNRNREIKQMLGKRVIWENMALEQHRIKFMASHFLSNKNQTHFNCPRYVVRYLLPTLCLNLTVA